MSTPRPQFLAYVVALSLGLAADQASKASAFAAEGLGGLREVAAGLFTGALIRNFGAAGSLASGSAPAPTILALMNLASIVTVTWWAHRRRAHLGTLQAVFIGLAAAGLAGNAVDRLTLGYVRDFLVSSLWPIWVFNLADVFFLFGLSLTIVSWMVPRPARPDCPCLG